MSTYTSINKLSIPNGLDDIGLHLGLPRIDGETLYNYQKRLILETRERSGPTQREFLKSLSRRVGEFDLPVFRITLDVDGNGAPLAADPYIEVTSTHIRAYSNWTLGTLDIELNFHDRDNGYFLRDIYAAFNASSFFGVTILDTEYTYKLSQRLRFSNTQMHVPAEALSRSYETKLTNTNIIDFYPDNRLAFITEKTSIAAMTTEGDYFVDYDNGVVFSYVTQSGIVSYTYMDFPFTLYFQSIRAYPYNDPDKKYKHKNTLISDDTGLPEYVLLNSFGSKIANEVLNVHPLTWGK